MQEIKMAVADGAKEIDIVINRFWWQKSWYFLFFCVFLRIICNWENQYPSDNWPWSSVGQNSMRKWSRWRYKKTNNIFGEKRNKKVPPSRQHVVQLTWSQSWLLESLAAWPMFTRCVDYTVLITWYWLLITSIDFTYFLTFRKKNLKIIQNKKLIEPLKGLFGVHDGWKRLHQDEHWQGGGQCYPSSWACHV